MATTAPIRLVLRRLRVESRGATIVEFALVCPAFLMALMGVFDLTYNAYTSSLLDGSIQKVARDSTIEGATTALDARVRSAVRQIAPMASVQTTRRSYTNYANVRQPEDFSDQNSNSLCDNGEAFEDVNGNNLWDRDRGSDGLGGARDAVLYTVTVSYPRQFPIDSFVPGVDENVSMTSQTVLRNQPYGQQEESSAVGHCA